ncbi:hypothetical protein GGF37_001585 [Kickxella alabastrina]|nr:hypothetical protein GGF37_001585 [Kickxella alabastrina]
MGAIVLAISAGIAFIILGAMLYSKRFRRRKLRKTNPEAYAAHVLGKKPSSQRQKSQPNHKNTAAASYPARVHSTSYANNPGQYKDNFTDDVNSVISLSPGTERDYFPPQRPAIVGAFGTRSGSPTTLNNNNTVSNRSSTHALDMLRGRFGNVGASQSSSNSTSASSSSEAELQRQRNRQSRVHVAPPMEIPNGQPMPMPMPMHMMHHQPPMQPQLIYHPQNMMPMPMPMQFVPNGPMQMHPMQIQAMQQGGPVNSQFATSGGPVNMDREIEEFDTWARTRQARSQQANNNGGEGSSGGVGGNSPMIDLGPVPEFMNDIGMDREGENKDDLPPPSYDQVNIFKKQERD